ncbi:MAG: ethanolamine ammonia-lyase subunit EutB [Loigolactobacillus coryniformis]|jgi:ethanolamine ammonia-lyase large subunit|uniref:Ethanolamine ammonia-lyase large subunit n=1 Tax=Loigolactobacillus coryniformis subsp. coryniformis CECT 5711 TaxID=1185325 RepID=J3JB96_9LACO|nr:ethanolamine ammonia-lyase subunit EutB [Loigolactobacillus coryniformis]EJN55537.1 Ethanolamine ammonia-lyase, large subunit [Loigolactobacillus coryniformis subsp. coryniformis CECT 5711]MBW4803208.1 ethanolamine ammonia-lyase subunit EutB [Loigolactobacillus coryniformis subsp. torquens]MBW4805903.1 ethanolamine ammonia-lyase subunit EutB [Loigolactobacillus coryniformis subsp. torquens]MDN5953974.1 ethanolamine ammonia-lyase subunit EutB [Loigolactobacillus coryniformis]
MILNAKLFNQLYQFKSVKEVMAKANELKSGDELAGVAASDAKERVAAKVVLAQLTLEDLYNNPAVPYEDDEVTRIIIDGVNQRIYSEIKNWTVSDLREWLLDDKTTDHEIRRIRQGLTSEMAAAVTKLMTNMDLVVAAKKIHVEKTANTTIGRPGTFSSRLQTNHPSDNIDGIMAGIMEGVSMGIGDAVIGLNPNDDSVESVTKILTKFEDFRSHWEIPTQCSVLAHVTTQMEAIRRGAPAGLIFQSIAGSEKANTAFGINADMLSEAYDLGLHQGQAAGPNIMYFETGEGSELSAEANFGADELTMEARCYGFAKKFDPFIVNTVVGFIGPEYLYNSKQVTRAGLEDHFMGKLQGISMGCDVCYTNHMKADQNDAEDLTILLAAAGCNYIMGIPHGDDVMLNYQTTGYQESATVREVFGYHPIKEFEQWMEKMGISHNGKLTDRAGDASIFLD